MPARAWALLVRNQLLGFLREPSAAVFNLAVPFFIIVVQAFAYGGQQARATDGALLHLRVVDLLAVNAATLYVMMIGLFGMGIGLASMVESRTLSTFKLRPGGLASAITSYGSVLLILTVVGLLASVAALAMGWQIVFDGRPVALVAILLAAIAMFLALGACVAGLSGSPRSAQGIASALFFPMLFLSGATYPIEGYPAALRVIAALLPGRHAFVLLSFGWVRSEEFPWASAAYVATACLVLPLLAGWLFSRREDL